MTTSHGWGILVVALSAACLSAAQPAKSSFDSARAYEDLRQLVSFGPRPSGSAALAEARRYMSQQLAAAGATVTEQAFDAATPLGSVHMVNLIGTLPGASKDRLIVAGHYDTKLFREFRFVGASDGASSAAFVLELARALKGRKNPLTIELLLLDGEEAVIDWTGTDHTYGSRHYVDAARRAGTLGTVRALILVDMIGDRQLNLRRDTNSTRWLTDEIWAAARRLKLNDYFLDQSARIEDDHVEFLEAGVPSVDLIDLDYPAWHTPNDTLEQVSARSLQIVGDVVLEALPVIEQRLANKTR